MFLFFQTAPMKFFYRISEQSIFTSQLPTIQETTTATTTTATTTTNSINKVKEEIHTATDSPPAALPIENPAPVPQPAPAPIPTPAPEVPETKTSVSPPPPQVTKHKSPPALIKNNPTPSNTQPPQPPTLPSPAPQVSKSQSAPVKSPMVKNISSSKTQGKTSTKSSNTPKIPGKPQQTPNSRQVGTTAKNSNSNLAKPSNNSAKSQTALPKSNQTKANSSPIAPRLLQPLAPKTATFTSKTPTIAPKALLPQIAKSPTTVNKAPSSPSVNSPVTPTKSPLPPKPPSSPSNVSQIIPKSSTNSVKTVANASKNVSVTSTPKMPVTSGPKVNNTAGAKSPIPNKAPKTACQPISMSSSPSTPNKTNLNSLQGTSKDQSNTVNNDKKEIVPNAITTKTSSSSTNSTTTPIVTSTASPLTTSSTTTTPLTTSTSTTASSSALATAASITQLLGNRGVFASPSVSPSSPNPASPRPGSGLTITPIAAPRQQPKPPPPQLQPLRSIPPKPSSLTIEARPRCDTPKPQNSSIYHQNVFTNKPKTQSNGQENNTSSGSGPSTPTHQQRHLSSGLFAAAMAGQRPDAKVCIFT